MSRAVKGPREKGGATPGGVAVADNGEGDPLGGIARGIVPDDIAGQFEILSAAPIGKAVPDLLRKRRVDPGIDAVIGEIGEQEQVLRRRDAVGILRRSAPARKPGRVDGIPPDRGRGVGGAVERRLQDRDRPSGTVHEPLRQTAARLGSARVDPAAALDGTGDRRRIVVAHEAVTAEVAGTAGLRVDPRQTQLVRVHIGDDSRLPRRFLRTEPDGETPLRKIESKGLGRARVGCFHLFSPFSYSGSIVAETRQNVKRRQEYRFRRGISA